MRRSAPPGWRSELLHLTMACIEILWLTPWVMVIMPGAGNLPGYGIVAFIGANVIGALLLVRLLTRGQASETVTNAAFLSGLALAMLLTVRVVLPIETLGSALPMFAVGKLFFPPVAISVALIGLLWYRGLRIATITVTPARASFSLRLGIIFQLVAAVIPNGRVQRTVLLLLPLFFFTGLLSTSMARSASLRINRETQRSSFGVGWIGFTALIGGILSLIGFVVALLLAGFKFDAILEVMGKLLTGIVLLMVALVSPLLYVIDAIFNALSHLITKNPLAIFNGAESLLAQFSKMVGPQNPLARELISYLPSLCIGGGLILIVLVMLITLRNRSRIVLREGEERETLDNAAILNSLKATLLRGLNNLGDVLGSLTRFGAGGAATAFTIRRLYARMSTLAERHGYPRGAAQTPFEYQTAILQAFPDFEREVRLLTRAYVEVHYGELPDNPDALTVAKLAVERMAALPTK